MFRVVRDGALLSTSRREMNSEEKPRAREISTKVYAADWVSGWFPISGRGR